MLLPRIKGISILISFALLSIILISSCEQEQIIVVDASIQPYFDLFEEEGNARGKTISLLAAKIEGTLTSIDDQNVTGQCAVNNSTGTKTIRIDPVFWESATTLEKEFLIFHELGHCYLDRRHLDETNSKGDCMSMMYSGNNVCKMQYSVATRSKYLDELFQ